MSNETSDGAIRDPKHDRDLTQADRDHVAKRKAEEDAHDAKHKPHD